MATLARPSPLGPEMYHDPGIFRQELDSIFAQRWIFVGSADQLERPDGFLTATVAGVPVIVQRFDGELRAFRNVCSHRHAIIRSEACGHGPLRCSYHGWTYDPDGVPVGIPGNQVQFGFSAAEKRALALQRFPLQSAGKFLFVRLAPEGPDLISFLGELHDLFVRLSGTFARPVDEGTQVWQANWKACVENTLETYHVGSIHGESLGMMYNPDGQVSLTGPHSTDANVMYDKSRSWWERVLRQTTLTPCPDCKDYRHFFIYPNLCVGLTYGSLLSMQTFEPLSPETTLLRYRLFLPAPREDTPDTAAFIRAIADYLKEFNQRVLIEDRVPVELLQRGTRVMHRPGWVGKSETRLERFLAQIATDVQ